MQTEKSSLQAEARRQSGGGAPAPVALPAAYSPAPVTQQASNPFGVGDLDSAFADGPTADIDRAFDSPQSTQNGGQNPFGGAGGGPFAMQPTAPSITGPFSSPALVSMGSNPFDLSGRTGESPARMCNCQSRTIPNAPARGGLN
jgi:hypothetical protein